MTNGPALRWRAWLGEGMAALALVAANALMVVMLFRIRGGPDWPLAGMMLGMNALLALLCGAVVRFRPVPLMAVFTTAALTEAYLLPSATTDRDPGWIILVAAIGSLMLLAFWTTFRASRERLRR